MSAKEPEVVGEPVEQGWVLRRCVRCGSPVINPMVLNCPRCWTLLPEIGCGDCGSCTHSGACGLR